MLTCIQLESATNEKQMLCNYIGNVETYGTSAILLTKISPLN
jgi:hypothetical protein